jgi:hypothetical protein
MLLVQNEHSDHDREKSPLLSIILFIFKIHFAVKICAAIVSMHFQLHRQSRLLDQTGNRLIMLDNVNRACYQIKVELHNCSKDAKFRRGQGEDFRSLQVTTYPS